MYGALLGVALAAGTGWAMAWEPVLALLPFAALVGVLLLVNGQARTAFLVFGGLVVLQSSAELNLIKVGYLLGVGVAIVGALYNLRRLEATPSYRLLRPLLILSLLFASLVTVSLGVAISNGTAVQDWMRDAAPYFLFASAPVFALDLHSSAPKKLLVAMFVIAGVLASLSNTVEWLDRRNLADLPLTRLVLPSPGLLSAIYIYALSGALLGSGNRAGWTMLSALILSLTWITANRVISVLLPGVAPLVGMFAARRERSLLRPLLRLLTIGSVALLLTLLLTQSLVRFAEFDVSKLTSRIGTITSVPANPEADRSYRDRASETRVAWQTFVSKPVLGAGPGHMFEWTNFLGKHRASFAIDTAMSFPAKFGVAGVILLLALTLAFVSFLRRAVQGAGITVAQAALVGYIALAFLVLPFASPFEDKGFSFGLLFLLALSLPDQSRHPDAEHDRGATTLVREATQ